MSTTPAIDRLSPSQAGRRRLLSALALGPVALAAPSLHARTFPDGKPVRLIVPFPAGGGVDLLARPLAPALSEALGVPVLIENIGGASGRIGTQRVAQAAADGHTLLLTNDTLVAADAVAEGAPLLPHLKPVTLTISSCNLFITHPKSGITDPASYRRQLQESKGQLTIGVPGWGTAHHLTSAALNHQLGVSAKYVPYRGGAPLIQDLLNGTLTAGVVTMAAALAHIQAGTLVGIAVTSKTRAAALPSVPTLDESIAPGFTHKTWQGILAPAGTPDALVARLHAAIGQALKNPRVLEVLPSQGFDAEGLPGTDFGALLSGSLRNFETVVKATNIQATQG
ncbi:Bug family tripartite tricarboxylate transporter substrate binding protein [Hydrogenophaga laconesensis]|uniref:Tripartite-type tricarboxylate transporter receptor subunit TctC n=1 Tax=Hydrogenophaga laconesensis TaxID=1805971 RepID=A0ABU1V7C0_9BURK|nr:tripartite tricarboxylate transporter substrate binding protein [Hydrogenophaga laconesensis]MDR7093342.1 tripartite-type tricarboxylate transporter receptor subunit TctC [Hydrogenophaga laconesensis]